MNVNSFKSPRRFVVYSYAVGHGPLLLRSGKTDAHKTRIDVLILDVRAMEIRMWFDGFAISETDSSYLLHFRSNPTEMMEVGLKVYALSGNNWQGFVVGGKLLVHEDEHEFGAPSALMNWTF
jgi:hypothetical protein